MKAWRGYKTPGLNKYRNKPTYVDGVRFDSIKEAARWNQLRVLERAGLIKDLERQTRHVIEVGAITICTYVSDFEYLEKNGDGWRRVVEDVKGIQTDVFKIKRLLMYAVHGINIKLT